MNGFGVGALERLEESHGRCEAFVSDAVVQWETERDEQLPQRQNQAEEREGCQDEVQDHARFLTGAAPRGKRLFRGRRRAVVL